MIVDLFSMVGGIIGLVPGRVRLCAGVALMAVVLGWVWSWIARDRDSARAVWVQITPPAHLPPDAEVRFARSLAGVLHRARRYPWRVRYVACEFVATDAGVRLGVWVPPAISTRAVIGAVTGAWPGATGEVSAPPELKSAGRVCGRELRLRGGEWSPVVDPSSGPAAFVRAGADTTDLLGQMLSVLGERRRGEVAVVQVIVAAQRGTRSGRPALRALDAVLAFIEEMGRELTRMNGSSSAGAQRPTAPALDPVQAARLRAIVAKKACGPHLRVTVRVAVSGPVRACSRAQAALIANGYDAVATAGDGLISRRMRGAAHKVPLRRPGTGFVATVAELGALWHIPADAARYGIEVTSARVRAPHRDVPRLETAAETGPETLDNRLETGWDFLGNALGPSAEMDR